MRIALINMIITKPVDRQMINSRNSTQPLSKCSGEGCNEKAMLRESADDYSRVLIKFFADWRLILCKHSKQWIIQQRSTKNPNSGVWIGRKHVTYKNSLLVVCSALHLIRDTVTADKVLALPAKVTGGSQNG